MNKVLTNKIPRNIDISTNLVHFLTRPAVLQPKFEVIQPKLGCWTAGLPSQLNRILISCSEESAGARGAAAAAEQETFTSGASDAGGRPGWTEFQHVTGFEQSSPVRP